VIRIGLLILLICQSVAAKSQFEQLRILFFSCNSVEGKKNFFDATRNLDLNRAENKAYQGVATAMYADVVESVSDKISYFNSGKDLLEQAITADWYNAEIRFLRFSVQAEVPFFLGYSDKKEEDARIVLDALYNAKIDYKTEFWKKALKFMVDSNELKDETESELRRYTV
jgi:hypothetical protein